MSPRLGVVVPVFNVEPYLLECLTSIASSTFGDFCVVVVDDGSSDDSANIAESFAAQDPRFTLVRQENAGPAHARNSGVALLPSSIEYISFIDADDVVSSDFFRRAITSLDASGSDFATCNVFRFTRHGAWQSPLFSSLSRGDRTATNISEFSGLVADRIVCNKVFRRSFWDACHLTFPEGRLYEDSPVALRAQYLARAVDVVSEPCYFWRITEGSITHHRANPVGVRDRLKAVSEISAFLAQHSSGAWPRLKTEFDRNALSDELVPFLEGVQHGSEEYREELSSGVRRFLDQATTDVLESLPRTLASQWRLVASGDFDALQRLRTWKLTATAERITYGSGRLRLVGRADVDGVRLRSPVSSVRALLLVEHGTGRRLVVPVKPRRMVVSDDSAGAAGADWSGWCGTVDLRRIAQHGQYRSGLWQIGLGILWRGRLAGDTLIGADTVFDGLPEAIRLAEGATLRLVRDAGRVKLLVAAE